ncbi:hypothetical protein HDU80_001123 [Chytriomyces hyalinus]|nr:hypothetical protein HDU80_001123 [Chytriomyces hyalinus]
MEDRRAPGPHDQLPDQSPKSLRNQLESMASELDSEIARQTIANQPRRKVASATAGSSASKPVTIRDPPRPTSSSSSAVVYSAPGTSRSKSQGPFDHLPSESNGAKTQMASDGANFTRNSPTTAVEILNFDGRPTTEREQVNFPDVAKLPLSKTKLSPLDTSKHPKMPLMPLGSTGTVKSAVISEPISTLNNGVSSSSSSIPYVESASSLFQTTAEITQTPSKYAPFSSPCSSAQHSRRNSLQNQLPAVRTSVSVISSKPAIDSEDIEDMETAKASKSDGELYHTKRCLEQEEEEEGMDKVLSLTEVTPQAIRHTHKHWHTYIPPPNTEELKIITELELKLAEALKSDPNLTLIASQDSLRTTGTNDTNHSTSVESDGSHPKKSLSVKSKVPLSSVIKTAKERMERLKQEEAAARELAAAETARLKLEMKKAEKDASLVTLGETAPVVKADDPQTSEPPLPPVRSIFEIFSSCCGSRNSRKVHPQQPLMSFPMELSDFRSSNSGGSRSSVYLGSICTAPSQPSSGSSGSRACVSLPRPTTLHAVGSTTSNARNSTSKTSASRRINNLDYVVPLGGERAFSSTTSASTTTSKTVSLGQPNSHLSSLNSSKESNQVSFLTAFAKAVQNTHSPNTLRHPSRHSSCTVPLPPIAQQKIRGPRRPQSNFETKPALTPCQEPLKSVKISQGRYSVLRVQDTIRDASKESQDSAATMHEEMPTSPPKFGAYLASKRECASSVDDEDWNRKTSNCSADGDMLELDTLSSFGECSGSQFSLAQQSKSPVPRVLNQDMLKSNTPCIWDKFYDIYDQRYEVKVVHGAEPEFHAVVEELANESSSEGTLSSFSSARMEFNGQPDAPTRQGSHVPGVVERAPTTALGGTEEISWFVTSAGALSTRILSTAASKGLFPHPLISTCRPAAKVFVLNSRDSANAFITTVNDASSNLKMDISSVGFDVEFWSNKPALVQIAFSPDIVGVFQLQPICGGFLASQNSLDLDSSRFPASLRHLLESQTIAKVGVGIRHDAELLAKHLNVKTENKIDCAMMPIARKIGARSLVSLYHTFVDDSAAFKKVNPVATGFNWGSSDLPIPAIEYAANDALASLLVYQAIENVSLKDMPENSETSDAQNAVKRWEQFKSSRDTERKLFPTSPWGRKKPVISLRLPSGFESRTNDLFSAIPSSNKTK